MRDLTLFILSYLVDNKDAVQVDEVEDENGAIQLTIHVDQTDMGKVIGKHGKIIRSLRDVIKIRAVKENKLVNIVLAE